MNTTNCCIKYRLVIGVLILAGARIATAQTGIIINGHELTGQQVRGMASLYGVTPPAGRYWYDARSGAWGLDGREAAGFIMPGHNLGVLSPNASRGNTGVYINGRQLNVADVLRLQQLVGAVYRGRWWLDGRTGNWGAEGEAQPRGNILSAMQPRQGSGDHFWTSQLGLGNWNGDCGYINAGGTTVGTGSCR